MRNGERLNPDRQNLKRRVAQEAATLLYFGIEKEYKQAKLKAAKTLRTSFLPTNLEVALELDRTAEENEGPARTERLIQMRKEALRLMRILKPFDPVLVGSVWRGTIHHESDIDIAIHRDNPEAVLKLLKQDGVKVTQTESVTVTKKGKRKGSFHIYAELSAHEKTEIKVCDPNEAEVREKCEIYGDEITGLSTQELGKLLSENPAKRFLPSADQ